MIKIDKISFNINETEILKDISLTAKKGEILTIVGPNGCGKSTLLKIISRILKPTSGEVKLMDKRVTSYDTKELARLMAILPQKKNASPDMTVEQLVQYGRYPHTGMSGRLLSEDYKRIDDAINSTGICHLRDRAIATLSGGESQMAWIAMCVAQNPQIILLDEPTTYLDICYQLEVLELVKNLNQRLGLTIIMVLHDINQAARYSDKVFMMKKGKGYSLGVPNEVFTKEAFEDVFHVDMHTFKENNIDYRYYIPERTVTNHV